MIAPALAWGLQRLLMPRIGLSVELLWTCCRCGFGGMNAAIEVQCIECQKRHCLDCNVEAAYAAQYGHVYKVVDMRNAWSALSRYYIPDEEEPRKQAKRKRRIAGAKSLKVEKQATSTASPDKYPSCLLTSSSSPLGKYREETQIEPHSKIHTVNIRQLEAGTDARPLLPDPGLPSQLHEEASSTGNASPNEIDGVARNLGGLLIQGSDDEDEGASRNDEDSRSPSKFWYLDLPPSTTGGAYGVHLQPHLEEVVLEKFLDSFHNWRQTPQGSPESISNGHATPSGGLPPPGQSPGGRKRKGDVEPSDVEETTARTESSKRRRAEDRRSSFACPFFKRDPRRYKFCVQYHLSRVRDVKQHLDRRHRRPIYCPTCMAQFNREDVRDRHIRDRLCLTRPQLAVEGITEPQKRELSKKSSSKLTEEEQWYAVFKIVFPDEPPPPSPYVDYELSDRILDLYAFMAERGTSVINQALEGHVIWNTPNGADEMAFRHYILACALRELVHNWENTTSSLQPETLAADSSIMAVPNDRHQAGTPFASSAMGPPPLPSAFSPAPSVGTPGGAVHHANMLDSALNTPMSQNSEPYVFTPRTPLESTSLAPSPFTGAQPRTFPPRDLTGAGGPFHNTEETPLTPENRNPLQGSANLEATGPSTPFEPLDGIDFDVDSILGDPLDELDVDIADFLRSHE